MTDGYCGKYLFDDTRQLEYDGVSQFNETIINGTIINGTIINGTIIKETMEKKPSRKFSTPNGVVLESELIFYLSTIGTILW